MKSSGKVYAIIPARGGSKSIPMKNMIPFRGVPLIDWVIQAGKKSSQIDKLLCTTDNDDIKKYCERQGVECVPRPPELATDSSKVQDAAKNLLEGLEKVGERPELVVLLQPTSPFIHSDHIAGCIRLLRSRPDANSSQTIAKISHNFHAYNQRVKEKGVVSFKFASEREKYFNKQKKPNLYKFCNSIINISFK